MMIPSPLDVEAFSENVDENCEENERQFGSTLIPCRYGVERRGR